MYFSLLFQVMSRTCLRFTPAAPSIVYSDYTRDLTGQFSSIYTFCPFLSVIHARGSTQFVHLPPAPPGLLYSDASATGGGAFFDFNNDFVCHKMWTENESFQSSTWRELSVIEFALQSFASVLEGSHVKWFTDSQAAAKIVEVGSMHEIGLEQDGS